MLVMESIETPDTKSDEPVGLHLGSPTRSKTRRGQRENRMSCLQHRVKVYPGVRAAHRNTYSSGRGKCPGAELN